MRITSPNELLQLKDGQEFRFRPIENIELVIDSVVRTFPSDERLDRQDSVGIRRVKIDLPIDQYLRSEIVSQMEGWPEEHQEIWHRQYAEVESGNIVDATGTASVFLDRLATALGWPIEGPRFDKVMLRRRDDKRLSAFHCDHFNSEPPRIRTLGSMERVIVNCGTTFRWFAALDIPRHIVAEIVADPYSAEDYLRLLKFRERHQLLLFEMPPVDPKSSLLHGIRFDAFSTLHCGYGMRGDMAAVLSHWTSISSA